MTDLCQGCGYQFDSPCEAYDIRHPETKELLCLCWECVDAVQGRWPKAKLQ
jgi:hypothetical protein